MKNNYLFILLCCFNIITLAEPVKGFSPSITTGSNPYDINTGSFVPAEIFAFDVTHQDGKDLLKWDVSVSPDLAEFQIENSTDNFHFFTVDSVFPKAISGDVASYQFASPLVIMGTRYYRIKLVYNNGDIEYSPVKIIDDATNNRVVILDNSSTQFQLQTPYLLHSVNVVNSNGQILIRYNEVPAGSKIIDMSAFAPGIYWIQCLSDKNEVLKIMNN